MGNLTEEIQVKKKLFAFLIALCVLCIALAAVACAKDPEEPEEVDTTPRIVLPAETLELQAGQTARITPELINVEGMVLWQSSAPSVASVDQSGLITAHEAGEAVVTAFIAVNRTQTDEGAAEAAAPAEGAQMVYADIAVKVLAKGETASIVFSSDRYTMSMYENLTLSPAFVLCSGTPAWTSSNTSVASVESDGTVIPHGFGTAYIMVTCGGVSAQTQVTVEESDQLPVLTFNREELSLLVGGELSLTPSVRFNGQAVQGFTVEAESLDPSVAAVSGGKVSGVSAGQTKIAVRVRYRGYEFAERRIPVTVKDDVNIVLSEHELDLYTKEIGGYDYKKAQKVTAEVYVSGVREAAASVTWQSADGQVAEVSQDGTVSARGVGQTKITATYTHGDDTYTATVNADVSLSVATYEDREIDLSAVASVDLAVSLEAGEAFERVTVNGNAVDAENSGNTVTVPSANLTAYYGEQEVHVETDRAAYVFPSLLITKSVASMAELRAIVTDEHTLGGYYILENDIVADGTDVGFRLLTEWSNVGNAGFIGTFDGRGHSISGLNIYRDGLFNCIGAAGVVKNLALVDVTGAGLAIATECRGTVDNVFVTSDTKKALMQMSDDCVLSNTFAVLTAAGSNIVDTVFSATCAVKNVYGYAGGIIRYTDYSQAADPTVLATTDIARLRAELLVKDLSAFDADYWETVGNVPVFKACKAMAEKTPAILFDDEFSLLAGQAVDVPVDTLAAISLQTPADGVTLDGNSITLTKSAAVTLVATSIWGKTAQKQVTFNVIDVAGDMYDCTDEYLFNYTLGDASVTFTRPQELSAVTKLSIGKLGYIEAGEGFTVSGDKITIESSVLDRVSEVYGDFEVTLTDGTDYYTYTCSFVTKVIRTLDDLESIRTTGDTLDGYYVLDRDIKAGPDTVAVACLIGEWTSLEDKGFVGILDGRGHSITGLKLTEKGLFCCMGKGVVRNLALVDVEVGTDSTLGYACAVFGNADCQSTTFENLFVSTNARSMFRNAFRNINVKNVVFVSTAQEGGYLSDSGNNNDSGSYTIENAFVVGEALYSYYGGTTPVSRDAYVYETEAALLSALNANSFAEWGGLFSFENGAILFNGKTVLSNA